MSEELGQSSVQTCPMCERPCDTTEWRHFRDPYSGQMEEFLSCTTCYEDIKETAQAAWREDFFPRSES